MSADRYMYGTAVIWININLSLLITLYDAVACCKHATTYICPPSLFPNIISPILSNQVQSILSHLIY